MEVSHIDMPPESADADTIVLGLYQGEQEPTGAAVPSEVLELIASGEAKGSFRSLALTHAHGKRWLLVGLGERGDFTPERARVAAAVARGRAQELSARTVCWQAPLDADGAADAQVVAAIVQGTILADYRFDAFKSSASGDQTAGPGNRAAANPGDQASAGPADQAAAGPADQPGSGDQSRTRRLQSLIVSAPGDMDRTVAEATVIAEAVNVARDLQNRPANDLTPTMLAEHARALARENPNLSIEVEGTEGLRARSMGAFAAVAQGSAQEPALITMRYEPPDPAGREATEHPGGHGAGGQDADSQGASAPAGTGKGAPPVLGLVGKAVTFDSGGISIKPGAKMAEMKFDMSGGAAVLQATAAIARLALPLRVIAVVGATENLPSGTAVKPGDIVTAANGKTIEVNNTDAEGRLVLADCLCHAVAQGAERIVDVATLTGAVITALGSTYAGLISNDDELAAQVERAGEASGEIVWRLPLHEEYEELIKGAYADLDNAPEGRKAGTIVGGTFLSNFVGQTEWAHLDIAGSAWDLGRAYAEKRASGYGVRLLVELARSMCD